MTHAIVQLRSVVRSPPVLGRSVLMLRQFLRRGWLSADQRSDVGVYQLIITIHAESGGGEATQAWPAASDEQQDQP